MLSPADHARIADAVARAESATTGEVACILAGEVSTYPEIPLAYAAAAALILPPLALAIGWRPGDLLDALGGWTVAHAVSADAAVFRAFGAYAVVQAVVFALVAGLVTIPAVRLALTPGFLKARRVRRAAWRHFLATGMHDDPERTGVLIFASLSERRVELLADEIIHRAAGEATWNAATAAVSGGMRRGAPAEGFVRAIDLCGEALARAFPATGPHANLLPNRLVEL